MTTATDWVRESADYALSHPKSYLHNYLSLHIADDVAFISREEFNYLDNYSATNPTGVYLHKCWKRAEVYEKQGETDRWLLCWFGPLDDDDMVPIHVRPLIFYTEENA